MRKFYLQNQNNTVELWLVQAIHEKTDFSFSLRDIPSVDFEANFRRKYEVEFMRIETMDPVGIDRPVFDQQMGIMVQSSAHSSVHSQNLARTISVASIQSGNNSKAEFSNQHQNLAPKEEFKSTSILNETSTSSLVHNS